MKEHRKYLTDEELLGNFYKSNDNAWLGILLQRYSLLLLGVCMKYLNDEEDAKDCVQEIFILSLNEIKRHKITYFKGWIYSVAKNHCLIKIRKERNIYFGTEELNDEKLDLGEADGIQEKIDREKMYALLDDSFNELSQEQKKCVALFYLENKSYKEIEQLTGFNASQVKSFIQNGKRNLKILMEKNSRH